MESWTIILTLLSLLGTLVLGISEISRRRAEAEKFKSEASKLNIDADTATMTAIKQAAIDVLNAIKIENTELKKENDRLREVVLDFQIRLEKCERCLKEQDKDCL